MSIYIVRCLRGAIVTVNFIKKDNANRKRCRYALAVQLRRAVRSRVFQDLLKPYNHAFKRLYLVSLLHCLCSPDNGQRPSGQGPIARTNSANTSGYLYDRTGYIIDLS
jgi:hypothetical protein